MSNNQDKVNDELLFALINKGGSVTASSKPEDSSMSDAEYRKYNNTLIQFQMRAPRWFVKQIDDECAKSYPIFQSRHSWILDAITTKLAKVDKPVSAKIAPTVPPVKETLPVPEQVRPGIPQNEIIAPTIKQPMSLDDMLKKHGIRKKNTNLFIG